MKKGILLFLSVLLCFGLAACALYDMLPLTLTFEDFRNSNGIISLGHINSGIEVILNRQDDFSVTLEK